MKKTLIPIISFILIVSQFLFAKIRTKKLDSNLILNSSNSSPSEWCLQHSSHCSHSSHYSSHSSHSSHYSSQFSYEDKTINHEKIDSIILSQYPQVQNINIYPDVIKSIHLKDLDGRENTKLTIVNGKCISINFAFLNNHALYDFHYYIMLNDSVTYLKLKKRFSGNSQKEWCVMLKNENDTRLKYLSNNIVKTKDWFVINLESAIKNEQ